MSEPGETTSAQSVSVVFDCTDAEFREAEKALAGDTKPLPAKRSGLIGWVVFIVMAAFIFVQSRKNLRPPTVATTVAVETTPLDVQIAGVVFGVALLTFAIGAFLVLRIMRQGRYQWVGQLKITIDETGIKYDRPGRIQWFAWKRFLGFLETPSTLILRDEPRRGMTIPKRLFSTPVDLEIVRDILRRNFAHDPKQRAFEVIPR